MPARPDRQALGAAAEAAALRHLEAAGLVLLARNARFKVGELDLVMRERDTLVFVEVRFRHDDRFGGGAASVDHRKRRRLTLSALAWLATRPALAQAPCRFDVASVSGPAPDFQVEWIPDAFAAGD